MATMALTGLEARAAMAVAPRQLVSVLPGLLLSYFRQERLMSSPWVGTVEMVVMAPISRAAAAIMATGMSTGPFRLITAMQVQAAMLRLSGFMLKVPRPCSLTRLM